MLGLLGGREGRGIGNYGERGWRWVGFREAGHVLVAREMGYINVLLVSVSCYLRVLTGRTVGTRWDLK